MLIIVPPAKVWHTFKSHFYKTPKLAILANLAIFDHFHQPQGSFLAIFIKQKNADIVFGVAPIYIEGP